MKTLYQGALDELAGVFDRLANRDADTAMT